MGNGVCVAGVGGWGCIIASLCVLYDNGDNAKHLLEHSDCCGKGLIGITYRLFPI